jgi:hypothetical protein
MNNFTNLIQQVINEEEDTKDIKVSHPGVLDIPDGKNFWEMPLSHFIGLGKSKGKAEIMKALCNLERWNKEKNPEESKKARIIIDKLKDNDEWENL